MERRDVQEEGSCLKFPREGTPKGRSDNNEGPFLHPLRYDRDKRRDAKEGEDRHACPNLFRAGKGTSSTLIWPQSNPLPCSFFSLTGGGRSLEVPSRPFALSGVVETIFGQQQKVH